MKLPRALCIAILLHAGCGTPQPCQDVVEGDIVKDYKEDAERADSKYAGKCAELSGTIESIERQGRGYRIVLNVPNAWLPIPLDCIGSTAVKNARAGGTVKIRGTVKRLEETWYGEGGLTIEPLPQLREADIVVN